MRAHAALLRDLGEKTMRKWPVIENKWRARAILPRQRQHWVIRIPIRRSVVILQIGPSIILRCKQKESSISYNSLSVAEFYFRLSKDYPNQTTPR